MASAKRIEAALDTIRLAVAAGAKVLLMSHVGRPEAGCRDPALSLAPVAAYLGRALGGEVKLYGDYLTQPPTLADGEVAVLENVRFNAGETANDGGTVPAIRLAVRHIRHGRLRYRPPRPSLDLRRGAVCARSVRRAVVDGGVGGVGEGSAKAATPVGRHRRRSQGFHQTDGAPLVAVAGGISSSPAAASPTPSSSPPGTRSANPCSNRRMWPRRAS